MARTKVQPNPPEDVYDLLDMYDINGKEVDNVNHPSHYTQGDIECIDAIRASMSVEAFVGYLKGNVLKYLWRYESKGKPVEDLEKACWYMGRLVQEISNKPTE